MPLSFLGAFAIALCTSMVLMPLMERLGFRWGAVSRPGGRNVHLRATARFGGPAIFIAFLLPIVLWGFLETSVSQAVQADPLRVVGLALGTLMMVVLGAWDDIKTVRARTKLVVQSTAAIAAYVCHYRIDIVSVPFVGDLALGWFGLPLTVLWIVGVVNAINLIDGLDGLAAGIVFFAATTNFTVAFISESNFVGLLMVSTLGAVLGFLFFNFNPARIFMGDSGSYFLGFVLAVTAISAPFQKASAAVSLLVPVVALGVPIVDTLFAMFRRILERRPVFSPDRRHIHHRLLDMGITHRRAVLIIYGISVVLAVAAIAISIGRDWQVGLAILVAAVVMFGLVRTAGLFGRAERPLLDRDDPVRIEHIRRGVPACLDALSKAADDAAIWLALKTFTDAAQLQGFDVIDVREGRDVKVEHFGETASSQARFTLGAEQTASTDLRFLYRNMGEMGDVQCGVLLHLLVDAVVLALQRVRSPRAPSV